MNDWWIYLLGGGLVNVAAAWKQDLLIMQHKYAHRDGPRRDWLGGAIEVVFYVLLWPIQILFWMTVLIHNLTGSALSRLMGERD